LISRQQADIAIRIPRPGDPRLVCRKIGDYGSALYASRQYLPKYPRPRRSAGLRGHDLINCVGPLPALGPPFMGESIEGARIVLRSNSTFAQLSAVAEGFGVAELPCYLADEHAELYRIWPDEVPKGVTLWLVTHEDLRRSARIRAVSDAIIESFRSRARLLRYGLSPRRVKTSVV
jgi:DNA-binding transcriptional LysR family regulator